MTIKDLANSYQEPKGISDKIALGLGLAFAMRG